MGSIEMIAYITWIWLGSFAAIKAALWLNPSLRASISVCLLVAAPCSDPITNTHFNRVGLCSTLRALLPVYLTDWMTHCLPANLSVRLRARLTKVLKFFGRRRGKAKALGYRKNEIDEYCSKAILGVINYGRRSRANWDQTACRIN